MKKRREAPVVELAVDDLSHDGRGVARHEGKVVFVADALPGERVLAQLHRRRRDFAEATLVEVLAPAADRVTPRCRHFGVCGGCVLQHLAPEAQIAAKQQQLLENFRRLADLAPARVLPPLTADVWHYRRKARLSVRHVEKKGRVLVGFRERNARYVADIQRCEVLDERVGPHIQAIAEMVGSLDTARDIAQIEVAAGQDMPVLVFRHLAPLPDADRERLIAFGQQMQFAIFLQPGGIDSVHPLWPERHELYFTLPRHQLRYDFLPLDFVQVNHSLNQAMVDQALELLAPSADERVLDLFCGLGNFSLPLARHAGEVVAVEGEAGLVQRACDNARSNGIDNVQFHAADLAGELKGQAWAGGHYDAVLIDPPRSGAQELLTRMRFSDASRLLYISCHPGSLARDAGILVRDHGWRLAAAGVMDMFPHTGHVESIALFDRAGKPGKSGKSGPH